MWRPGSGGGRGRAGRGGRRAPLNSAAPAWRGRRPDRGRAGAAGTAHGPGRDASAVRGYMRGTPTPTALTFSSVCTNWSTGMEPLSRGFRTLQSVMSSLARFRFLPPVGWAGLGRRKTGVSSRNQPGAPGPCRPPAGPSSWEGTGPGPVPLSVPRVRVSVSSWISTQYTQAEAAIHRIIISAGKDTFLLARSVFNFQSTQFSRIRLP